MQFTSTKDNSRQQTERTLIRADKNQIHANKNPVLHIQNPIHSNKTQFTTAYAVSRYYLEFKGK